LRSYCIHVASVIARPSSRRIVSAIREGEGRVLRGIPVVHVGHQLHVLLHGGNLLSRARLRPTHSEERHLNLTRGF
jgi:hypothetical protein